MTQNPSLVLDNHKDTITKKQRKKKQKILFWVWKNKNV